MIVYFADRQLNVLGTASTNLPDGIVILDDLKKEDLDSGVRTFEVKFAYDNDTRDLIRENIAVGNFLLRSVDNENEFYTIVTTEQNTADQTVHAYAEDAGLDLLNTIAPAFENTTSHDCEWYVNKYLPNGWSIGINELTSGTQALQWEGESTVTERLLSIANSFNGEIDFSYEIERLTVTKRMVNLYHSRGNSTAMHQLRLGGDISRITTNKSIENLATAFECKGGTPSGKTVPINLSGADYSSDGKTTHSPAVATDDYQIVGTQVRCTSAMERWASSLDDDGLLVRQYSYDTTNKQELFSHAVAELRKVVNEETTYDLEFITFPEDARLGDWMDVVDDKDNLYLEGRILALEKSITQGSTKATLGEWVIKTSGIAERLADLAEQIRQQALSATTIMVTSSNGLIFSNTAIYTTLTATVYYGDDVITNQTRLEEVFGSGVSIKWYSNGTLVGTGFTYSVNSANASESYVVKLEES